MTTKQLCLLLDHQARHDLRQACAKGHINRSHYKQKGVKLLIGLGLIEQTKTLKTMYRYQPTDLGRTASAFLPSGEAEWNHVMHKQALVYGDGTQIDHNDVPRYFYVRDYDKPIREARENPSEK